MFPRFGDKRQTLAALVWCTSEVWTGVWVGRGCRQASVRAAYGRLAATTAMHCACVRWYPVVASARAALDKVELPTPTVRADVNTQAAFATAGAGGHAPRISSK